MHPTCPFPPLSPAMSIPVPTQSERYLHRADQQEKAASALLAMVLSREALAASKASEQPEGPVGVDPEPPIKKAKKKKDTKERKESKQSKQRRAAADSQLQCGRVLGAGPILVGPRYAGHHPVPFAHRAQWPKGASLWQ
jgi:hypothetical protein